MYTFSKAEYVIRQKALGPSQRMLFLYDEDGQYPFAEINVWRWTVHGLSFIGEPIIVPTAQARDWRYTTRKFYKTMREHGQDSMESRKELEAFAGINKKCH